MNNPEHSFFTLFLSFVQVYTYISFNVLVFKFSFLFIYFALKSLDIILVYRAGRERNKVGYYFHRGEKGEYEKFKGVWYKTSSMVKYANYHSGSTSTPAIMKEKEQVFKFKCFLIEL